MFVHEANWDEIVNKPLFHGTTASYLSLTYHGVRSSAWKKYRNISKSEKTSVVLQKYLQERRIIKPSARTQRDIDDLIFSYQSLTST